MTKFRALITCIFILASVNVSAAKSKKRTTKKAVAGKSTTRAAVRKPELSKNLNFEDMIVRGKYQYSDEMTAAVENEKALADLLDVRKDFKDRMQLTQQRN